MEIYIGGSLLLTALMVIAWWKIFEKAGEAGWKCLIPIYNIIIQLRIVGKPGWWIIWFLIPIANIVVWIWVTNLFSMSFGKGTGYTVGLIFLPIIFYPILGLGDAEYRKLS